MVQPEEDAQPVVQNKTSKSKTTAAEALKKAEAIATAVDGQVERVAVFQDAPLEDVNRVLRRVEGEHHVQRQSQSA